MTRSARALVFLSAACVIVIRAGVEPARLLAISARTDNNGSLSLILEASEPVGYSTRQPDPATLLIELRNASARSVVREIPSSGSAPITGVTIAESVAADGAVVSTVRVALEGPTAFNVRSARNTIQVEFATQEVAPLFQPLPRASSPGAAAASAAGVAPSSGPAIDVASVLSSIETEEFPEGIQIRFHGNGRMVPASVGDAGAWPPRLVLDFANLSFRVPPVTQVNRGPIERIRVSLNSRSPLGTRVVVDLTRAVDYRVVPAEGGDEDLTILLVEATAPVIPVREITSGGRDPLSPAPTATASGGVIVLDAMAALKEPVAEPPPSAARLGTPGGAPAGTASDSGPSNPVPTQSQQFVASSAVAAPAPPAIVVAPALSAPAPAAAAQSIVPLPPGPIAPAPAPPPPPPAMQSAVPPVSPSQSISGGQGDRQYTGHPVTLDFQNADLRAVLRAFSEISGLNMVIDPTVQGTVDVRLNDVPWDQALDIILRANKLGYTLDGTVVRIAPVTVLSEEEGQRRKFAEEQALSGDLRVVTRTLSYARASALAGLITRTALSQRGTVQVDERTNTLIITDLQERLDTAAGLINTLDRPEPQVEIEARVVQTNKDFLREIGVQLGVTGRVAPELGNTTGLVFPNNGGVTGRANAIPQGPIGIDPRAGANEAAGTAVNLPASAATSAIGLALGAVNGSFNLDVALSALEREGKGRVLSTPRVSTQNNVEAEITQGIQIPIQTVANNTVTVTFKDAALTLRVTPQITSANTVIMRIILENASPDFTRSVNGIPPIDTQRANTQVQVNDGATTVIGGIFLSREQTVNDRTPFLHRIPLLGWLFKRDRVEDSSRELLIFITPRIIRG